MTLYWGARIPRGRDSFVGRYAWCYHDYPLVSAIVLSYCVSLADNLEVGDFLLMISYRIFA